MLSVGRLQRHMPHGLDGALVDLDHPGGHHRPVVFFFSSRRRHTRFKCDWSSDVCSSDLPWPGADHMDFSADGSYLMISTEYSGVVAKVDVNKMKLVGFVKVGGLPIDVKVSPDGTVFYVSNQGLSGVSVIDSVAMKVVKFIPTGRGAHGFQVSRDTKLLYVSNRLEGSFSVISFATRSVVAKWFIPGGGSPDMLQLNPAGTQLWASGRYNATVYVMNTVTGKLIAKIPVGSEDHGLTYFPNVGLHSLGHNGVYR